jgi:hypothetical protein
MILRLNPYDGAALLDALSKYFDRLAVDFVPRSEAQCEGTGCAELARFCGQHCPECGDPPELNPHGGT